MPEIIEMASSVAKINKSSDAHFWALFSKIS